MCGKSLSLILTFALLTIAKQSVLLSAIPRTSVWSHARSTRCSHRLLLLSNSWSHFSYGMQKTSTGCMEQNSKQRQVCREKHKKCGASHKKQKLTHDISVQKRNRGCEAQ